MGVPGTRVRGQLAHSHVAGWWAQSVCTLAFCPCGVGLRVANGRTVRPGRCLINHLVLTLLLPESLGDTAGRAELGGWAGGGVTSTSSLQSHELSRAQLAASALNPKPFSALAPLPSTHLGDKPGK